MSDDSLPRSTLVLAHVLNSQFPPPVSLPMASTSTAEVSTNISLPSLSQSSDDVLTMNGQGSTSLSSPAPGGGIDQDVNIDVDHVPGHDHDSASNNSLKRMASPEFESTTTAKRIREDEDEDAADRDDDEDMEVSGSDGEQARRSAKDKDTIARIDGEALAEHLSQELHCGCCSELVYKPVIVTPCQHFFCGSCCTLWIKNGGTSCPACRGVSTVVTPSRALQAMVDVLLRADPSRMRTERERQQADEVYPQLRTLRFPEPREPSPEPNIPISSDFVRPCPHCTPGNPYGWHCSTPIVDPNSDADNAWHVDDGAPPGHGFCGNCEVVLALQAPTTTKCDLCQVSFCGINVQSRCTALPLMQQHPHGLSDIGDLIQSSDVYECFDGNTVEVEYMLDYLTAQRLSPRHVYREIVTHILAQPTGFRPLIEMDLFSDLHPVAGGLDPDPNAPRQRVCRMCAAEVLLYGMREWWIRERRKGFLDPEAEMAKRKDCPDGRECRRQSDLAHAKEFNHVIVPPIPDAPTEASQAEQPNTEGPQSAPSAVLDASLPSQTQTQGEVQPQDLPLPISPDRILPALPTQMPIGEPGPLANLPGTTLPALLLGEQTEADLDFEERVARAIGLGAGNVSIANGVGQEFEQALNARFGLGQSMAIDEQQQQYNQQQHQAPSLPQPLVLRHHREGGGSVVLPSFGSLFARFGEGEVGSGNLSEDEESIAEGIIGRGSIVTNGTGNRDEAMGSVSGANGSSTGSAMGMNEQDVERDRDSEGEAPADTPIDRSLELEGESTTSGHRQLVSNVGGMDAEPEYAGDVGNSSSSQLSAHEVELVLGGTPESDSQEEEDSSSSSGKFVDDTFANESTFAELPANKSDFLTREEIGMTMGFDAGMNSFVGGSMSGSNGLKMLQDSGSNMDVDDLASQQHQQRAGAHVMVVASTALPVE